MLQFGKRKEDDFNVISLRYIYAYIYIYIYEYNKFKSTMAATVRTLEQAEIVENLVSIVASLLVGHRNFWGCCNFYTNGWRNFTLLSLVISQFCGQGRRLYCSFNGLLHSCWLSPNKVIFFKVQLQFLKGQWQIVSFIQIVILWY